MVAPDEVSVTNILCAFSNALVDFMLNGTAIKSALESGKNLDGEACDKIYSSCPLTKEQSLQIFSKLLPNAASASSKWIFYSIWSVVANYHISTIWTNSTNCTLSFMLFISLNKYIAWIIQIFVFFLVLHQSFRSAIEPCQRCSVIDFKWKLLDLQMTWFHRLVLFLIRERLESFLFCAELPSVNIMWSVDQRLANTFQDWSHL